MREEKLQKVFWQDFLLDLNELLNKIRRSRVKPTHIYGIPRGGLIPAVILSHFLEIPLIDKEQLQQLKGGVRLLIIDDVSDEGKSLMAITAKLKCDYLTMVLYVKSLSLFRPDFFLHDIDSDVWIKFPWEKSTRANERKVKIRK